MALSYEDWFKQIYAPSHTNESGFVDQFSPEQMARFYSQYSQPEVWQGLTDEQFNDFNSPFWQNRYSADTPWQQVVAENSSTDLLGRMADSGYLNRFQGYDDAARAQVYDLVHNLAQGDRRSHRQNNIWAASPFLGALGGYLAFGSGAGAGPAGAESAAAGGSAAGAGSDVLAGAGDMFGAGTVYDAGAAGLTGPAAGGATGAGVSMGDAAVAGGGGAAATTLNSGGADDTGAFDQYGSQATPGAASQSTVFDGAATNNGLGGGAAAGSALSRVLDGTATSADWLQVLGSGAATGLGVFGSINQTNALKDLAAQQMAIGAPSRARYEASFSPDFRVTDIPGYSDALDTSWQTMLRKLSAGNGNPFGNPGGLTEANKYIYGNVALPAIQNYRTQNANTGGYSSFNTAAPTTATNAIGSQNDIYNTIGAGIADVTRQQRPRVDLSELYRSLA